MDKNAKIYVAGHNGMVGSAVLRRLRSEGYTNLVTRSSKELDLRDQAAARAFFAAEKPEYVFLCAARVGGIIFNMEHPAEMMYDNLAIQCNALQAAYENGVTKLLLLGSSCIYPRLAPQPMKEEYLLTGPLEPTNEGYAIAKIAGMKMCEYYNQQYGTRYISVMPCNLYGENDNYDPNNSHVLSALVRKFVQAKDAGSPAVEVWGTGQARREFLYVDDLADACVFLMRGYDATPFLNVGTGEDITIRQLAETIGNIVGFEGELVFNTEKPDGMPRKVMDISKITALGWAPKTSLEEGIRLTIADYRRKQG